MGLYTEATYREYGPHWRENLFYSHLLSLPLFLPFASAMYSSYGRMAASDPLNWQSSISALNYLFAKAPRQLLFLVINVLTQYACIRGVNLLAAMSTALTVTIVLNIRKLMSLLLSIWLFGNTLAPGTLLGALVVFSAGGLYSFSSSASKAKPASQQDGQVKPQASVEKEG
jgi:UDP-xylose/UDP-N-acetylglucosamine transporter B4